MNEHKIVIYLLEAFAIIVVSKYLLNRTPLDMWNQPISTLIMLLVPVALTHVILDTFAPKVAPSVRQGTGFSIGMKQVGGDKPVSEMTPFQHYMAHVNKLAHGKQSNNVLSGNANPNNILAGNANPNNILAGNANPNNILAGNANPNNVLAGNANPNNILAGNANPNNVLAGNANRNTRPKYSNAKDIITGRAAHNDVLAGTGNSRPKVSRVDGKPLPPSGYKKYSHNHTNLRCGKDLENHIRAHAEMDEEMKQIIKDIRRDRNVSGKSGPAPIDAATADILGIDDALGTSGIKEKEKLLKEKIAVKVLNSLGEDNNKTNIQKKACDSLLRNICNHPQVNQQGCSTFNKKLEILRKDKDFNCEVLLNDKWLHEYVDSMKENGDMQSEEVDDELEYGCNKEDCCPDLARIICEHNGVDDVECSNSTNEIQNMNNEQCFNAIATLPEHLQNLVKKVKARRQGEGLSEEEINTPNTPQYINRPYPGACKNFTDKLCVNSIKNSTDCKVVSNAVKDEMNDYSCKRVEDRYYESIDQLQYVNDSIMRGKIKNIVDKVSRPPTNGLVLRIHETNKAGEKLKLIKKVQHMENINYSWGSGYILDTGRKDGIYLDFVGFIKVPKTKKYTFRAKSDDGVRFMFDGKYIINRWRLQGATYTTSSEITLEKDKYYPINLNWYEHKGGATLILEWKSEDDTRFDVVPEEVFYQSKGTNKKPNIVAFPGYGTQTGGKPWIPKRSKYRI